MNGAKEISDHQPLLSLSWNLLTIAEKIITKVTIYAMYKNIFPKIEVLFPLAEPDISVAKDAPKITKPKIRNGTRISISGNIGPSTLLNQYLLRETLPSNEHNDKNNDFIKNS